MRIFSINTTASYTQQKRNNTAFKSLPNKFVRADKLGEIFHNCKDIPKNVIKSLYKLDSIEHFSQAANNLTTEQIIELGSLASHYENEVEALLRGKILKYVPKTTIFGKVLDLKFIAQHPRINLYKEVIKAMDVITNCQELLKKMPSDVDAKSSCITHINKFDAYVRFIDGEKDVIKTADELAKKDFHQQIIIYGGDLPNEQSYIKEYKLKKFIQQKNAKKVKGLEEIPRPQNLVDFLKNADPATQKAGYELCAIPYFNAAVAHLKSDELKELFEIKARYQEYVNALIDGDIYVEASSAMSKAQTFPKLKDIVEHNLTLADDKKIKLNDELERNYISRMVFDVFDELKEFHGEKCKPEDILISLEFDKKSVDVVAHIMGEDNLFPFNFILSPTDNILKSMLEKESDKTIRIAMSDAFIDKMTKYQQAWNSGEAK